MFLERKKKKKKTMILLNFSHSKLPSSQWSSGISFSIIWKGFMNIFVPRAETYWFLKLDEMTLTSDYKHWWYYLLESDDLEGWNNRNQINLNTMKARVLNIYFTCCNSHLGTAKNKGNILREMYHYRHF